MKRIGIRRGFSIVAGLAQSTLGAFVTFFAYLLYHDSFGMQALLNVSPNDVVLYMFVFIVFGLLSIASGLFLVNES